MPQVGQYETKLSPADEAKFQEWVKHSKITDVGHPDSFYDYRGFWKEHGDKPMRFGVDHFTDTYKQPGHPTFSVESKYATGDNLGKAGSWGGPDGETFIPPAAKIDKRSSMADFYESLRQQQPEPQGPAAPPVLGPPDPRRAAVTRQAVQKDPARESKVLSLSQQTGLPMATVERNFDQLSAWSAAKTGPLPRLDPVKNPVLIDWMGNPKNAGPFHDDVEPLSAIEHLVNVGRFVGFSLQSAAAGAVGYAEAFASMPVPMEGQDIDPEAWARLNRKGVGGPLVEALEDRRRMAQAAAERIRGTDYLRAGPTAQAIYSGIGSTAQVLALLPLGPVGMLAGMGVTTAGQSAIEGKDQGLPPAVNLAFASADGAIEVGMEMLPVSLLYKQLHLSAPFFKTLLKEMAAEIPGEQITTALQDLNAWAVLPVNKDATFQDYLDARPGAAYQTLVATLVGTIGQAGIVRLAAQHFGGKPPQQLFIEALGKQASDSKTAQRLPAKLQELVASMTKDGPLETLHMPIDTFQTYWQEQQIDPRSIAEELGVGAVYDHAILTNTDLPIPTAVYAAKLAASPHNAFFSKELRFAPGQMNAREQEEFEAEADKIAKELGVEMGSETAPTEQTANSAAKVREDVTGQLTGQLPPDVVQYYAALHEATFRTIGLRAGLDPFALYQKYGLRITRPGPEILRSKLDVSTALDPLIDRLRSGKLPTQAEMYGPSLREFVVTRGGVKDEGGDLASREPDKELKPHQKAKRLIQPETGLAMDRAREAAAEAGYLDAQSSIADFLELLTGEIGGKPVYAPSQSNALAIEENLVLEQLASYLGAKGVDLKTASNADIRKILEQAQQEPAGGQVLDQRANPQQDVPGLRRISKFLTPAENKKQRMDTAETLVEHFKTMPPLSDFAATAEAGKAKKGWYAESTRAIVAIFGVDAPRFTALLAAMSPQTSVQENLKNTLTLWKNWRAAGSPADPRIAKAVDTPGVALALTFVKMVGKKRVVIKEAEAKRILKEKGFPMEAYAIARQQLQIMGDSVSGDKGIGSVLDAWIGNALRALNTEDPIGLRISGPKVNSFMLNLRGFVNEVTNDAWMANFALVDQKLFSGKLLKTGDPGKGPGYLAMSAKSRQAAKFLTETTGDLWTPSEVQETIWSWTKTAYELASETGKTVEQLLREGAITDELIADTPDFGTLFREDETYRSILEEAGYGDVIRNLEDTTGNTGRDPGAEGAERAGRVRQTDAGSSNIPAGLLRSARRLDRLRKQRAAEAAAKVSTTLDQSAFHGSPHQFEEFSLQHMGTGEGAQSFGWGLYFAGNKEVAEYYRKVLATKAPVSFDGNDIFDSAILNDVPEEAGRRALMEVRDVGNIDDAITKLRKDSYRSIETRKQNEEAGAWLRENRDRISVGPKGRLYTVDIPEDSEYLQWDAKLDGKTPDAIWSIVRSLPQLFTQEELTGHLPWVMESQGALLQGRAPLARLYQVLSVMKSPQWASELLASKGIPGIRYLDQDSRPDNVMEREFLNTVERHGGDVEAAADDFIRFIHESEKEKARIRQSLIQNYTPPTYNYVVFDDKLIKVLEYEQQFDSGKRGGLDIGNRSRMELRLLQTFNLSTFLHESGHFFLEIMGDVVADLEKLETRLPLQQKMVDDYQKLIPALGVESVEAWRGMNLEQRREAHELFARTFEAYLREGKAPSPELRSMFRRFRDWLVDVYSALTKLNVTLRPEVTAILDRLVATDEEIARAEDEAGILALIEDVGRRESVGASAKEWKVYGDAVREADDLKKEKLQRKFLDEFGERSKAWFVARRAEVRDQIAAALYRQREYMALAFFQKGTLPDGSPLPEGVTAFKLDANEIDERYGKAVGAKRRTAENPGSTIANALLDRRVYSRKDGIPVDQAASLFGYSSGDELVTALANTRDPEQLINALTDEQMRDSYGDMLTDGTAAEAAADAVMTEGRAELIEARMKAYAARMAELAPAVQLGKEQERAQQKDARAAGIRDYKTFIPKLSAVRDYAERIVRGTTVRELKKGTYQAAARTASRKATEAALKDDYAGALAWSQKELLNVELYRATVEAQKRVEGVRKYQRSFEDPKRRQNIGKAGEDYLDQIDALWARYGFQQLSNKQIDRRKKLAEWIADREAQGLPVDIPEQLRVEAGQRNYRDVSVEELIGLRDAVENIAHLARLKNKLLKAKDKREFEAAIGDMVTSIDGNAKGPRSRQFELRLPGDKAARAVSGFFASHRKLSSFIRQMDGWKDGGVMWERILRPINEAADIETVRIQQATRELAEIFDRAFAGEQRSLYVKKHLEAIGGPITRMGRIMVALNWGNDGNRQRVLAGGLGFGGSLNEQQVGAILATLNDKDWDFVRDVWKHVDSYWGEISDKQQRVTGVRPEKVEAAPFQVGTLNLPGGYFPIKYEGQASAGAAANLEASFADSIKQASYTQATTRRGHTKERQTNVTQPVRLDFGVITEHVQAVLHDLTHHEMLIDAGRLLGDKRVSSAIYGHFGNETYSQLKSAIEDIARGMQPAPDWLKPINALRQGAVTASLGWNLVTSALQPLGAINGMVRVGPKWVLGGIVRWGRDAATMENTVTWIHERSAFMRTRGATQFRELNEIRNQVGLDTGKVSGWIQDNLAKLGVNPSHMPAIADSYFYLIQKAQQLADVPTWLGAYEKAMSQEGNSEDRSVALADQAVIDAQGSGHVKDLAKVERAPALKILTTFYTYPNMVFNQVFEAAKARRAIDAAVLMFGLPALEFGIREALRGGDDDDDKSLVERLIRHEVAGLLGMMVGLRELSGAVQGYPWQGPVGLRVIPAIGRLAIQAGQLELDPAFWRALNETGGIFFQYPAVQVQRTVEGMLALGKGETQNPAVLLFGPPKE